MTVPGISMMIPTNWYGVIILPNNLPTTLRELRLEMSDILDEAQALVQCKACPWYKSCVLPMRLTGDDLRNQLESSIPGVATSGTEQYGMQQLLSGLASAAENSILEGCPVFINRLRSRPKLAEQIKKLMQEWTKESQ